MQGLNNTDCCHDYEEAHHYESDVTYEICKHCGYKRLLRGTVRFIHNFKDEYFDEWITTPLFKQPGPILLTHWPFN